MKKNKAESFLTFMAILILAHIPIVIDNKYLFSIGILLILFISLKLFLISKE